MSAPSQAEDATSAVGERWIAWVGGALVAAPVLLAPYPPMTDFPHHEALVALLRYFGDASLWPPGLYVRNLGQPNQLFHMLAWALSFVVPIVWACKLVVAAALVAIPVSAARLAKHLGATAWTSLALAPIALGWLFYWGFVANLIALAVLFAWLPALDRFADSPTPRRAIVAVLGSVLLYSAHELVMFVYVAAAVIFAAAHPLKPKATAMRLVPAVVALAMALVQIVLQEKLKTATVASIPTVFLPLPRKLIGIPGVLFGGSEMMPRLLMLGTAAAAVAALLVARHGARTASSAAATNDDERDTALARTQAWILARRFWLVALVSLAAFLLLPLAYNGATLVYQRFLAPAFGLAVVCAGVGTLRARLLLPRVLFAMLPLEALLVAWPAFADASHVAEDLESLIIRIPRESAVAGIDLDLDQGGRPFTVASGLSRVLALRGGRVLYSFADSTVSPVMMAPAYQWNEVATRTVRDNYAFRPSHDLTRFRYLIVHSSNEKNLLLAAAALDPDAVPVARAGEWGLFESTLEVVPLTSPDVPLPTPRPDTLRKRMRDLTR